MPTRKRNATSGPTTPSNKTTNPEVPQIGTGARPKRTAGHEADAGLERELDAVGPDDPGEPEDLRRILDKPETDRTRDDLGVLVQHLTKALTSHVELLDRAVTELDSVVAALSSALAERDNAVAARDEAVSLLSTSKLKPLPKKRGPKPKLTPKVAAALAVIAGRMPHVAAAERFARWQLEQEGLNPNHHRTRLKQYTKTWANRVSEAKRVTSASIDPDLSSEQHSQDPKRQLTLLEADHLKRSKSNT